MTVHQSPGIAGITLKITADDTSNDLINDGVLPMSADLGQQTGAVIKAALITVETNDLRFTHGVAAAQGGSALGHILVVGDSMMLSDPASIRSFEYINETNSSNSVMMVTPYYHRGSAK